MSTTRASSVRLRQPRPRDENSPPLESRASTEKLLDRRGSTQPSFPHGPSASPATAIPVGCTAFPAACSDGGATGEGREGERVWRQLGLPPDSSKLDGDAGATKLDNTCT